MILIFSTFANKKEAVRIGKGLLKKKLIACYNLLPVESAYWWKNKIEEANEVLMLMKARKENYKKVEKYISKNHSYETPEIIAVESKEVSERYLKWIKDVTD